MGRLCSVLFCESTGTRSDGITYHRLPSKKPKLLARWKLITLRGKSWHPPKSTFICSKHFDPSCFIEGRCLRQLKKNSIPTRIQMSKKFKKKQPMVYLCIEQQLLRQPGVTEVKCGEYVNCEFDDNTIKEFEVVCEQHISKTRKKSIKVEADSETEESTSEDEPVEKSIREDEVNVVWDKPIKEEVDPLDISGTVPDEENEDYILPERISIDSANLIVPENSLEQDKLTSEPVELQGLNILQDGHATSNSKDTVDNNIAHISMCSVETSSVMSINVLETDKSDPLELNGSKIIQNIVDAVENSIVQKSVCSVETNVAGATLTNVLEADKSDPLELQEPNKSLQDRSTTSNSKDTIDNNIAHISMCSVETNVAMLTDILEADKSDPLELQEVNKSLQDSNTTSNSKDTVENVCCVETNVTGTMSTDTLESDKSNPVESNGSKIIPNNLGDNTSAGSKDTIENNVTQKSMHSVETNLTGVMSTNVLEPDKSDALETNG